MTSIHVAFASDDHYAQHMAVSIASLLKSSDPEPDIHIYILFESLSKKHLQNLTTLMDLRPKTDIHFLKLSLDDFKDFPLHTQWHSIATYFRLKLPSLLPDVTHIAYLDSDIVVCDDLTEIWERFCADSSMIWAVEEPMALYAHRLESLGMTQGHPYFNGGVLLMNLAKMREVEFEKKSKDYIQAYSDRIQYQDQDVLNKLSEGDWKPLPLRWNSFFFVMEGIYDAGYSLYCLDDIHQARKNPAIIHYNQHPKPWAPGCIDPRRQAYFDVIAQTPYRTFRLAPISSFLMAGSFLVRRFLFWLDQNIPSLYLAVRTIERSMFDK